MLLKERVKQGNQNRELYQVIKLYKYSEFIKIFRYGFCTLFSENYKNMLAHLFKNCKLHLLYVIKIDEEKLKLVLILIKLQFF